MSNETGGEVKPKGKGKKALNKLNDVNKEIDLVTGQLKSASDILLQMISNGTGQFTKIDGMQLKPLESNLNKKRSMITAIPDRIDFEFKNLDFYIDFTVVNASSEDPIGLKGSIIYGTYRTLCFTKCIFPAGNTNDNKICKNCGRITRCDRLEDKPLLQFTVNRNGLIKSGGEIDDEWWIKENEDLLDMHLRALEFIWGKALDWTNESLLP